MLDFTSFSTAVGEVTEAITDTVGPAMVGIAVAALGVSLAVGWVRRIRSAV